MSPYPGRKLASVWASKSQVGSISATLRQPEAVATDLRPAVQRTLGRMRQQARIPQQGRDLAIAIAAVLPR
jgi:hypothetical protein